MFDDEVFLFHSGDRRLRRAGGPGLPEAEHPAAVPGQGPGPRHGLPPETPVSPLHPCWVWLWDPLSLCLSLSVGVSLLVFMGLTVPPSWSVTLSLAVQVALNRQDR